MHRLVGRFKCIAFTKWRHSEARHSGDQSLAANVNNVMTDGRVHEQSDIRIITTYCCQ